MTLLKAIARIEAMEARIAELEGQVSELVAAAEIAAQGEPVRRGRQRKAEPS